MLDEQAVLDALRCIPDPELGIDIVELGLVDRIEIDGGSIHVRYTLTTFGCGIGPMLESQMYEVLYALPGVTDVVPQLVFDPPWTRERMSPRAREIVGDRELNPTGAWSHLERLLAELDDPETPR
jgi:metal-sulfur cluster biosynthetic enzyme